MALYRYLHTSFWDDPYVVEKLTPESRYFYIFLMTNNKTNQIGCYEISIKSIVDGTGYNRDIVEKLLDKLIDENKILHDKDTNEILLLNWHKYSWTKSPKVITCILKEYTEVKSQYFRDILIKLFIDHGYGIDSLCNKEKEKQKEKQKEKYKKDNVQPNGSTKSVSKKNIEYFFENAWKLYPNKKGKGQISDTKKKALYEVGEELHRAIDRYKKEWEKDSDWRKPQNGSTFFNSGYVDYLDANYVPGDTTERCTSES